MGEGQEFATILRLLERYIQTVKDQNNFLNRITFLLIPGGFSDPINLNNYDSNWKNNQDLETQRNRQKMFLLLKAYCSNRLFFYWTFLISDSNRPCKQTNASQEREDSDGHKNVWKGKNTLVYRNVSQHLKKIFLLYFMPEA